jgi:tripartite-type tricarboxylate transporter receptor subunit TctC
MTKRLFTPALTTLAAVAGVMLGTVSIGASAQAFDHAIRIVVPYAPGGTSDTLARILAEPLRAALGQTVVVENKPGAAGNIGADTVAKAPKDGHTYLLADVGTLSTAPALFPDLTYKLTDLAPVSMVMFSPYVLAVNDKLPVNNVAELVAYAKANPGKLAVANSGVGGVNHIAAVAIAKQLGIEWKTVPYRGGSAATQAVVSGESKVIFNGATATLPFVVNKQMRGLAVSGDERIASVADVPTFKEAKLPYEDVGSWQGIVTTAGSPPALVEKFNVAVNEILKRPEVIERIKQQGGKVSAGTPADLGKWLASNATTWGKVIADAGIKAE